MNLEPAAKSLLEQFPSGDRPDLARRERRLEKFGQIAFSGFLVVIVFAVLGMIYAILDRMVFSGERPLVGLIFLAFLVFATLSLAYVFLSEDLKERRRKMNVETQKELEMSQVTGRLLDESTLEPIPTVTESTTDLLPRENTRKF